MSEDAAQGAATAAEGTVSAAEAAALNPVFRTAPAADTGGQQGTATQKPAGRQQAAQGRTAAAGDGDRSPEELLADAAADGDGTEDPLAKANAELAKWKQQARDNEKRAKLNAEKAKNYDAYEESQKTEQQRLADQLAAAQREAQDAREDRFRLLAAAQYDLPPSLIAHLGGGTEDEITERAEAFAAGDQRTRRCPRRSPGPGRRAGTAPQRQRRRVPARRVPPPRRAPRQRQQARSEPQRVVPRHARQLEERQ